MDLTGQVLIAMPGMSDPRFVRSVVFICAHSDEGAMGLIVNKPAKDVTLKEVLSRLDVMADDRAEDALVYIGGPVETERGFVLHRDAHRLNEDTLPIGEGFVLTATQDILVDVAQGVGPEVFVFTLGYAGWAAGQLESEILQNAWLTAPATPELIFETVGVAMWETALRSIGINPITLSGAAGRA
ncbi:YqgE/AlgH family protein [Sulfitobacter donghicola]|uniref:UPF0301 protein DSW25_14060 n=2 Tax=Sulfitobacter TaxID=60136 RepID=A0A073IEI2_9RHOB|nr:YqgE/AlgH family protein [Sulfitobacter donghicola]KEJ88768.1 hypothetical protein DSW25_14060 [Sulfitobacter donghicola DSW-25 = KCTC 12864 = JCM 14565]